MRIHPLPPESKNSRQGASFILLRLKRVVTLAFISLVLFAGYRGIHLAIKQDKALNKAQERSSSLIEPLPFKQLNPDTSNRTKVFRTYLFHFNPDCDHCVYEAEMLHAEIQAFDVAQLIWVSAADSSAIHQFAQEHQLLDRPNVTWMKDTAHVFKQIFGYGEVPSVWIYDEHGQLIQHYLGETKIATLLKHLKYESETD